MSVGMANHDASQRPRALLRPAKDIVRELAWRRYSTAKVYELARLRLVQPRDPIVVYTVGKVGSTTVARSLAASGLRRPVYQVHWLSADRLATLDSFYRAGSQKYRGTPRAQRFRPEFVWLGKHLARRIASTPNTRWQVITLVRDPVARNISSFFQNMDSFFDYWLDEKAVVSGINEMAQDLVELFMDGYLRDPVQDGDPLTWFDEELRPVFDVNVYGEEFPRARGFHIYKSHNADVLVLRLEDLDRSGREAFRRFLGLDGYRTDRRNVGADKAYAAVYDRFLDMVRLTESYLDRLYTAKYTAHFYSQDEIAGFRARWCN